MDKALFSGGEDFDGREIERGALRNLTSDVAERLKGFGWLGRIAGCICLTLSPDNKSVRAGVLAVRGPVDDKELRVDSNKIWPAASADTCVSIKLPAANIFKFGDGGLCSDYVAEEEVQHAVYENTEGRGPTPVLEADYEERGIGSFCIRMTCIISKSSSARTGVMLKWTVLLFPDAKERILELYEGAKSPAWPGLRLTEGELPMLPRPTTAWRCPMIPLVLPGQVISQSLDLPAPEDLRRTIGAIMAKGVLPETSRTGNAVTTKWRRLANNPEELTENRGKVLWPTSTPQQPATGKQRYPNQTGREGEKGVWGGKDERTGGGGGGTRDFKHQL